MRTNWERVVDLSRGLENTSAAVDELTPSEVSQSQLFSKVHKSAQDLAPEMWVARAKALLVAQRSSASWIGKLVPVHNGPVVGYRSGGESAQNLRCPFDDFEVIVTIEQIVESDMVSVVGLVRPPMAGLQFGTQDQILGTCDPDGYFEIELAPANRAFQLTDSKQQTYKVELP